VKSSSSLKLKTPDGQSGIFIHAICLNQKKLANKKLAHSQKIKIDTLVPAKNIYHQQPLRME